MAGGFRHFAARLGVPADAASRPSEIDQGVLDRLDAIVRADRKLRWSFMQRGFWVHGTGNLRDYLRSAELFTMEGRAGLIRCPTLMTMAEHDPLAASAQAFFDALRCPKTLLQFNAAEGAGGHCEMQNRSLLNRRALDWIDEQFAQ